MKTSELIGGQLDYWAHLASGVVPVPENELTEYEKSWSTHAVYWRGGDGEIAGTEPVSNLGSPSTDWDVGGPIIDREEISVVRGVSDSCWVAGTQYFHQGGFTGRGYGEGSTAIIAAMRALVASKFGDEVPEVSP